MSALYDVRLMPFCDGLIFFKRCHFYRTECFNKTELDLVELCAELGRNVRRRDFNRSWVWVICWPIVRLL